jgi:orotidine-5'-phosphate decarboxylase
MTEAISARTATHDNGRRIIVALDVSNTDQAMGIVNELAGSVGAFKIGLELFTTAGPSFVERLTSEGHRIFLDLKFFDIPTTVAKAATAVAKLGVWMFNVHAMGGREMLQRTREAVDAVGGARPLVLGVTVLTSSDGSSLEGAGLGANVDDMVMRLAALSAECGLDGVVSSAQNSAGIRSVHGEHLTIVTPGIRPAFATIGDQKRVMTPAEALAAGSDYLVIGRPITDAADRQSAVERIVSELGSIDTQGENH